MPAEKYVEPQRVERIRMRMARDPLWEQVKLEAKGRLEKESLVGPQLYQLILSQASLLNTVVGIVAHEIEARWNSCRLRRFGGYVRIFCTMRTTTPFTWMLSQRPFTVTVTAPVLSRPFS
eukprot:scaffold230157_cov47-Attheya_sp.AAC.1